MHNVEPGELVSLVVASEVKNSSYVCGRVRGKQTLVKIYYDELLIGTVVAIVTLGDLNEGMRESIRSVLRQQLDGGRTKSMLPKHLQVEVVLVTSHQSTHAAVGHLFVGSLVFTVADERFVRPRLIDVA